jgi:predicted RNA-binding Zn-ribbon protein involved in translation (DUF1610 family)
MYDPTTLSSIVALVNQGKYVVSGEDSLLVSAVFSAMNEGRTATFYVTPAQYEAVMSQYWTPERVAQTGIMPISEDESQRIKSEFNLDVSGHSNEFNCPNCGNRYGAYEFFRQGIEEHGREIVDKIFTLKEVRIIRVNPTQVPGCPSCHVRIPTSKHYYYYEEYGCCEKNPV